MMGNGLPWRSRVCQSPEQALSVQVFVLAVFFFQSDGQEGLVVLIPVWNGVGNFGHWLPSLPCSFFTQDRQLKLLDRCPCLRTDSTQEYELTKWGLSYPTSKLILVHLHPPWSTPQPSTLQIACKPLADCQSYPLLAECSIRFHGPSRRPATNSEL